MFEEQQGIIDDIRNELLEVANQIKGEFLSKVPELIQECVRRKISENPHVFQQLADPAVSALKTRVEGAISEVIKLIDSAVNDYTLCEVEDLTEELRSVSRRADGLVAPIIEEIGFKLKRKEGGLELEEHIIDFQSYCEGKYTDQIKYLTKVYTEKKSSYMSAISHLDKLKSEALSKEALDRWDNAAVSSS